MQQEMVKIWHFLGIICFIWFAFDGRVSPEFSFLVILSNFQAKFLFVFDLTKLYLEWREGLLVVLDTTEWFSTIIITKQSGTRQCQWQRRVKTLPSHRWSDEKDHTNVLNSRVSLSSSCDSCDNSYVKDTSQLAYEKTPFSLKEQSNQYNSKRTTQGL